MRMQPGVAVDRRRAGELQDELDIGPLTLGRLSSPAQRGRGTMRSMVEGASVIAELGARLLLAPVFTEVLDDERFDGRNRQQPLARGVDGETGEIAGNPAAAELLGDGGGRAAADEAVEDEVAFGLKQRLVFFPGGLLAFGVG